MSELKEPTPAKLITALLYPKGEQLQQLKSQLEESFGPIDWQSPEFEFNHTRYYTEEMGENLAKGLISFTNPIAKEKLPEIKIFTNRLEQELAQAGNRRINIDPGYLTIDHLILASGKYTAHRIYLGKRVYAEVELIYQTGSFRPLPWTYPDYRSELVIDFLNKVREQLKEQPKIKN